MSIAEVIPAIHTLSRREKFELAHLLLEELAAEELSFPQDRVFPIYTPEYHPAAASQLAQALKDQGLGS